MLTSVKPAASSIPFDTKRLAACTPCENRRPKACRNERQAPPGHFGAMGPPRFSSL